MKKFLLALSLISMIMSACKSSETVVPVVQAPTVPDSSDLENSLLWEISGNGLAQSSFLYGTIHLIDKEDYFLPQGTLSAMDQSEEIYFEIDMSEMSDVSKLMPLLQKAYMDDDLTLKDLLDDNEYEIVQDHFKELGLPLFFMERIKPMFLTVFASGDMNPGDIQSGKVKSYEMEFNKIAEESNKPVGGLETIEYQISIFDSIPYKDQADMLIETIKAGDTGDDQFAELVELYKNQDVAGLYNVMKTDESIDEFEDVLLVQRNKNWIPVMSDKMTTKRTFFAVGAGHLGGSFGVINLLREAGYTVTAVNPVTSTDG